MSGSQIALWAALALAIAYFSLTVWAPVRPAARLAVLAAILGPTGVYLLAVSSGSKPSIHLDAAWFSILACWLVRTRGAPWRVIPVEHLRDDADVARHIEFGWGFLVSVLALWACVSFGVYGEL